MRRVFLVYVNCDEDIGSYGHWKDRKVGIINVFALLSERRMVEGNNQVDSPRSTDNVRRGNLIQFHEFVIERFIALYLLFEDRLVVDGGESVEEGDVVGRHGGD
jgi:hypothetical protein